MRKTIEIDEKTLIVNYQIIRGKPDHLFGHPDDWEQGEPDEVLIDGLYDPVTGHDVLLSDEQFDKLDDELLKTARYEA